MAGARATVGAVEVAAFTVPTEEPESDGTLAWGKTTLVRVEVAAGGTRGWGWTYADTATARLVADKLRGVVSGRWYFRRMLGAGAVDVLQADATRCGGYTGFFEAAALCDAWGLPLSSHCAPALHAPVACAAPRLVHMEWFHDHVRIERMLLDGFLPATGGAVRPDRARLGHGYEWKAKDAEKLRV